MGFDGEFTMTMRVRGVIARAIASMSSEKSVASRAAVTGTRLAACSIGLVAEPSGRRDDDFVAGVGDQRERERDRTECALSHRDVVRLEVESELAAEPLRHRLLRRPLIGLVRVPVDRSRFELRAHGIGEAGQSHLVRIAEGEIQRVGILRERLHAG